MATMDIQLRRRSLGSTRPFGLVVGNPLVMKDMAAAAPDAAAYAPVDSTVLGLLEEAAGSARATGRP
jgi:hypothetical protein